MSQTIITFEPGTLRGPSDPLVTFEQKHITHQDEYMILILDKTDSLTTILFELRDNKS